MIDRYVYAVTKRLPETQRKDVADELHGLIEDMLNEHAETGNVGEESVREVLLELGPPRSLAQKYRGGKRFVIGPELYDLYMLVLKIAFISVVLSFTIGFVIK